MIKKLCSTLFAICLVLCISIISPISIAANELNPEETPMLRASNHMEFYYTSISTLGGGKLSIYSSVRTLQSASIRIDLSLQVYENGSWKTLTTWSKTGNGLLCTDSYTYNGISGKDYRVASSFIAIVGSDKEVRTASASATAK